MRVVLAAREEDGGAGCDGDGVLRLTRVIIVCCRHCASLLWHPVVYNVHISGTALALIKYSFTFTHSWLRQTGYICQLHTTRV